MRIKDLFGRGRPLFSFEFFPPKTDKGMEALRRTLAELSVLEPSFVSVTYGAGGSTRERTVELVANIKNVARVEAMAHVTCAAASAHEIGLVLDRLAAANVRNVLALRGDPPEGESCFRQPEGGFAHANELVTFIRSRWSFCVGGACYPEGHVECRDLAQDLHNLKKKVDAGADFLITQLFFENEVYFAFAARARALGISVPLIPGIMPITNVGQVKRFTSLCGASIPAPLMARLEAVAEDGEEVERIGIEHATQQCRALLAAGAPGIHFYTLNKSPATRRILANLLG
ncbi:MAG: methylenetetrahydrofolate reductase [NAD(P)H] [Planctomycetes bacterium]|nr:methylenetetrahydrofolate reductase [NAD(P)H] [Planctomycetota bacterium]